jgi:Holliday junction resolvase RusA-like endonuclease
MEADPVNAITITVYGVPAPQGSKTGFAIIRNGEYTGGVALAESSKKVKPWRAAVTAAAREVIDGIRGGLVWHPLDGPLEAVMVFTLARPRSHYGTGRNAGVLREGAPARPTGYPDASKLVRSTEDALTDARLWADDARVVEYTRIAKLYAGDLGALTSPGAFIGVRNWTPPGLPPFGGMWEPDQIVFGGDA